MLQPVSQVISNSNQTTIAPEISCLETQIPNGNQGQKKKNDGEGSQGYSSNPTQTTTGHESVRVAQNLSTVRPELVKNQQGTINVFVHDNEGEVPAENHTSFIDGVKVSFSSILCRQAVSKKNLPFYAPTIAEGEQVIELEDDRPSNNETITRETRNSKGIENTNEEELTWSWETPSRKHITRARTTAECRENRLNVVQGITQVIQQNEEPRYTDTDKAKRKAIATQGQQQGGRNGKKIEGFMKDARRSDTPSKDDKGNAKGNVSQHTQQYKRGN
ncbi:hypothetical protein FRX31_022859 [Thalictrum thalictroides]|uniref:Uncharacterized protein n=1 Tax=Thalictrum thalictroides TaxID=46969 RepID=A0A7J6VTL5_THATH|nr:hypothetical protein FRX31_022859 [Thalictrum thalictroides]